MKCVVSSCNSQECTREREGKSFHRIPQNNPMRDRWLSILGLSKDLNKKVLVCSDHFPDCSFVCTSNGKRQLKKFAVPFLLPSSSTAVKVKPLLVLSANTSATGNTPAPPVFPSVPELTDTGRWFKVVTLRDELSNQPKTILEPANVIVVKEQILTEVETVIPKQRKIQSAPTSIPYLSSDDEYEGPEIVIAKPPQKKNRKLNDEISDVEYLYEDEDEDFLDVANLKESRTLTMSIEIEKNKNSKKPRIKKPSKETLSLRKILRMLFKRGFLTNENRNELQNVLNKSSDETVSYNSIKCSQYRKYSRKVRKFAMKLNLLSPDGYNCAKTKHKRLLPHPRAIYRWLQSNNCYPGFISEAFTAVERAVKISESKDEKTVICLVFGEIFLNNSQEGVTDIDFISKNSHTHGIVFMANGVNQNWSLPLGYFLLTKPNAAQKKNLIVHCMENLLNIGVEVVGVCSSDLETIQILCCDAQDVQDQYSFFQLDDLSEKFIAHLDPVEMLKSIAMSLKEFRCFINENQESIQFKYLEALVQLQEQNQMISDSKIEKAQKYFALSKLNMRLEVQLFKKSVADAIDFCRETLLLAEFQGSEATAEFLRMCNEIISVLTSYDLSDVGLKQALFFGNRMSIENFSKKAIKYISNLKTSSGEVIISHCCGTGFAGLMKCLKNIDLIYQRFIENDLLPFVPFERITKNSLNSFFASVKFQSENLNPSKEQFLACYKQLVEQCQVLDDQNKADFNAQLIHKQNFIAEINKTSERFALIEDSNVANEFVYELFLDNYEHLIEPRTQTAFIEKIVFDVANLVVMELNQSLYCSECIAAILGNRISSQKIKTSLFRPSDDVVTICQSVEQFLQTNCFTEDQSCSDGSAKIDELLDTVGFDLAKKNLFKSYTSHMVRRNHLSLLINAICVKYFNIRYYFLRNFI